MIGDSVVHDSIEHERIKLFSLYVQLAGRVTNLRTILQNDLTAFPPTQVDGVLWAEDFRSVATDLLTLATATRDLLRLTIPREPSNDQPSSLS